MNHRPRACVAIIRDGMILMVLHVHKGHSWWTLPGGGVEGDETLEQAAVREALEEANVHVKVVRRLFEKPYPFGMEYCYLAELLSDTEPSLGYDPEFLGEPPERQLIQALQWHSLESMKGDKQVALVLKALATNTVQIITFDQRTKS